MTIRDNVIEVKRKILLEVTQVNKPFTKDVQDKAVAAILKGFGENDECIAYMKLFALDAMPNQLRRLMGRDGTTGGETNAGRDRARAYLMANGPCGTDTVLNFENGVTSDLD